VARELRVHALIDSLTAGGAETLLADFAAGAPAAGIDLTVGYLQERGGDPAAARLRAQGIEPELVGIESMLHPRDHRRVREHIARADPDVVHTHLGYADFLGGFAARRLGRASVSTVHVTSWNPGLRENVKERLMARARRRCAARVIAVSDSARALLVDGGWDSAERVTTIHNGIAAPPPRRTREDVRAELGLAPGDIVVATLGVLRAGKGHAEAIAAVDALLSRVPRLRLLVVGDGPERHVVETLARPLGDAVVLAGWREDVPDLLAGVDVVLHPSFADAFPTALLEAMAASVPVVASSVGGIPEIVDDGVTGTLIPAPPRADALAAALEPLATDAELRARVGSAARERFERHFTAESWAQRLRALYDEVLRVAGDGEPSRRADTAATTRSATRSQV
jgi:glycosyltransferase involved in cell wall biosynthesis